MIIFLILLTLHGAVSLEATPLEGFVENVTIPILSKEKLPLGTIQGRWAKATGEHTLEIQKASLLYLLPNSPRKWRLKVSKCWFNKEKNALQADAPVQMDSKGIFIDGQGLDWLFNKNQITIRNNVTLDFSSKQFKNSKQLKLSK